MRAWNLRQTMQKRFWQWLRRWSKKAHAQEEVTLAMILEKPGYEISPSIVRKHFKAMKVSLYKLKEKPLLEDDIEKRAEWRTIRNSRPKKTCIRKPHAVLDNKNFEATRCAKRCILVELMLGWSMGCHCCQGLLVELVLWWLMSCHFCQCILFGHILW